MASGVKTVGGEIERDGFSYYTSAKFFIQNAGDDRWAELMEVAIDDAPAGGIELTDFELQKLEHKALAA